MKCPKCSTPLDAAEVHYSVTRGSSIVNCPCGVNLCYECKGRRTRSRKPLLCPTCLNRGWWYNIIHNTKPKSLIRPVTTSMGSLSVDKAVVEACRAPEDTTP